MFIRKFWQNLRITRKLFYTFAILLSLIFLVAGYSYISLRRIILNNDKVMGRNFQIERLVLEIKAGLQSARQGERSFILKYPEIGFHNAYALYGEKVIEDVEVVIEESEALKGLVHSGGEMQESTVSLFASLATQYKYSYQEVVSIVEELAIPVTGLESQLENATTTLGLYVDNRPILGELYRDIVNAQLAYLRNKQSEVLYGAIEQAKRLQSATQSLYANSERVSDQVLLRNVEQVSERFQVIAVDVINANGRMNHQLERMDLQASSIVPASERLLQYAEEQTRIALKNTNSIQRYTTFTMLIASVLAFLISFLTINLLKRSITDNVMLLSRTASLLREGDLSVRVDISSQDEIGVLAHSFNSMADQLSQLVNNLEDHVEERTSDLVKANDEINRLNNRLKEENLRMEGELDLTRKLQNMVLPAPYEMKNIQGLDVSGYMSPATEVGGDYYDVLQKDGNIKIGIGDVTGHGLESGILMLMTQTAVRTLMNGEESMGGEELSNVDFFNILNQTIYDNLERMGINKSLTLSLLDYSLDEDQGIGRVSLSGQHEQLVILRRDGQIELYDTLDLGFPLGLERDISRFIKEENIDLYPGDGMVLYTDGITEAENIEGTQYGIDRFCTSISRYWDEPSIDVCRHVIEDLYEYIGDAPIYDDITLLVMKQI